VDPDRPHKLELLDGTEEGVKAWGGDLPIRLQRMHSHWFCTDTVVLHGLLYQKRGVSFFLEPASNTSTVVGNGALSKLCFRVEENQRQVHSTELRKETRQGESQLLRMLQKLETDAGLVHTLHAAQNGALLFELPRYDLAFQLVGGQLQCLSYRGFKLASARKVIVPAGPVRRQARRVSVQRPSACDAHRSLHAYDEHGCFGTLEAPAGPLAVEARLQLAALNAAADAELPEPCQRRTGGEAAVELLRQSWANRPLSSMKSGYLQSIVLFGMRTPALALLCRELDQSAWELVFLQPDRRCDLPLQLDIDAASDYSHRNQRGQLNPRATVSADEEMRVLGLGVASPQGRLPDAGSLEVHPVDLTMSELEVSLLRSLSYVPSAGWHASAFNMRRAANLEPLPTPRDLARATWASTDFLLFNPFLSEAAVLCLSKGTLYVVTCYLSEHPGATIQLNMGWGKTRVILPMLLLSLAQSDLLLRLHFPSPLLGEAYHLLHRHQTASLMNRRMYMLSFHGDVRLEPQSVQRIYESLLRCKASLGAVCVAPGEARAAQLRRVIVEIPFLDLMDESDEILYSKFQLIYAVGSCCELPAGKERWAGAQALLKQLQTSTKIAAILQRSKCRVASGIAAGDGGLLACGLLLHCLCLRRLVEYGVDRRRGKNRLVAVPYRASDTPFDHAEFAQPDTLILLTHLSYYHDGLTREEYALWLRSAHLLTAEQGAPLDDVRILDLSNELQLALLHTVYAHNMAAVDFWLATCVVPRDAYHLADNVQKRVVGFSGTKDNALLLPLPVQQMHPECAELMGTDGRMLDLVRRCRRVICLDGSHPSKAVLELAVPEADALIDAGATMAGLSN
ncbi:hypothetical protein B484DRAFT_398675, partial [Ochromonadaceae sp. CCMP2298]